MARFASFTVTGTGPFPMDMLRADSCWPANKESVAAMRASWFGVRELEDGTPDLSPVVWSIRLAKGGFPTARKWAAVGWPVERKSKAED